MTQKLVIANWKMNGTLQESRDLLKELYLGIDKLHLMEGKTVICPPYCYASYVLGRLAEMGWLLGGQDCSIHEKGAYTGEVSANMLKDIGCSYVLVGHSERRQHHKEDNQMVNAKMGRAFQAGLTPVLCIGETLAEYEADYTLKVLETQLLECLYNHTSREFVIAYEPVWAIGTGKVAQTEDIQKVHQHIRNILQKVKQLSQIPILYGGSVNAQNAREILSSEEVDGVLVGGASLKANDFKTILENAAVNG